MKTILLIWYNQNHNTFNHRFCLGIDLLVYGYSVGYKNSYGHEIISILLIDDKKCIDIKDYKDYSNYYNRKRKKSKEDLIDKTIRLLNRLKK